MHLPGELEHRGVSRPKRISRGKVNADGCSGREVNFDPKFAAPSQWAAIYRACNLQVVPARMPAAKNTWKTPALPEWKSLQEELVVNRRPILTPYRRPILTPLSRGFGR